MKPRNFFIVLFCAVLLTGCAKGTETISQSETTSAESRVESVSESFSESTKSSQSEAIQSSESSFESSSESSESSVIKPVITVPTADLDESSIVVDKENKTMTIPFTTDVPFQTGVKYYLRIYFTDSQWGGGELRYDEPFDTSQKSITLKLHEGNNYYFIQFHTDEIEGDTSNQIYQEFVSDYYTPSQSNESSSSVRNVRSDYAATDLLGLTVSEAAEVCGHYPSDYAIAQDEASYDVMFQADDDVVLYSLVGTYDGEIRMVEITSSRIPITSGFGSIDKIRVGMSRNEIENILGGEHYLQSYGYDTYGTMSVSGLDFDFIFDKNQILIYCSIFSDGITF